MKKAQLIMDDKEKKALLNARKLEKKRMMECGRKPSKPAEWVLLGDMLVKWSQQSKSVDIDDFARLHNFPPYYFSTKWLGENEYFAECFQKALYNVGERRHAMLKDSEKYLMRTLPLYDLRLQDLDKQDKDQQRNQNITVEMKAFPSSDRVPVRKSTVEDSSLLKDENEE
jgi:hypothetical protein